MKLRVPRLSRLFRRRRRAMAAGPPRRDDGSGGGSAGVREPRTPLPRSGAGAGSLPPE
ncbi:MAG: hypothetical protein ACJ73S_05825 [Mycobacteriales bacterium]